MGFKGVNYCDLKKKVGFLPVIPAEIAMKFPAFLNALNMLESENDRNAIKDFISAIGVQFSDCTVSGDDLGLFDVRALSKKYLASHSLKKIAEEYGYTPESEDEVDEIVDLASTFPEWKRASDGEPALRKAILSYLPEDEKDEDEDEDEDEEVDEDDEKTSEDGEVRKVVFTFGFHHI